MARLFTEGFELGDGTMLDYASGMTISSPGRTGTYFLTAYENGSWYKNLPSATEMYAFTGYSSGSYNGVGLSLRQGANNIAWISKDDSNTYYAYFEATLIGSIVLSPSTWYMLEIHLKIDDAPNGIAEFRVNGYTFATFTGDTKVSYTTIDNVYGARTYEGDHSWDDIAVNDSSGLEDNSWVGDCRVSYLPANDNGDESDWMGSDADKVNNYALVDDVPTNGDTDYVWSSTPGDQDLYNVADFSGTGKTIRRIWPEARAKDSANASGQIKLGFKTGGSVYLSSAKTLTGAYRCVKGDAATVNPADSGAWEDADIDAIQFATENQ